MDIDNQTTEKLISAVLQIEKALVNKDYKSVASGSDHKSRLTENEIEQALKAYGGELTVAPKKSLLRIHPIKIQNSKDESYAIDFDLWVDNKQSDLTVSLTVTNINNHFIASIDDIHVL